MAAATYRGFGAVNGTGTPAGTYTFAGMSIGPADIDRTVIVPIAWRSGANFVSATIGGIAAVLLGVPHENPSTGMTEAFIRAAVPTGITATVVVVVDAASNRMAIGVFTTTDNMAWGAVTTSFASINGSGLASPQVLPIEGPIVAGGFAIGIAAFASAGTSLAWAWTGLTEDDEQSVDTLRFSFASVSNAVGANPFLMTATASVTGTINDPTALVVLVAPVGIATPNRRRAQPLIWSPAGPAVAAGVSPARGQFVAAGNLNLGGVAWVYNDTTTSETFTIGGGSVTNTMVIPLGPDQGMFVAYGPTEGFISATVATIFAVPGIART